MTRLEEFVSLVVDDSAEWPDAVEMLRQRDARLRAQHRAELLRELADVEHSEGWDALFQYDLYRHDHSGEGDYAKQHTWAAWRDHVGRERELRRRAEQEST